MIIYNMRERGPYEYDKFVLNILQLHNAVNLAELNEMVDATNNKESLKSMNDIIDNLYIKIIGSKKELGISEKISLEHYKYKGALQ